MTEDLPSVYLDLARRISDDHHSRVGSDHVVVVPVIVENFEFARTIAECLTGLIGGAALASPSKDPFEPGRGHSYTGVASAVEAALTINYPLERRSIRVIIIPAEVTNDQNLQADPTYQLSLAYEPTAGGSASVAAVPASSLSTGQQAMLGLANSLLDHRFTEGEIAVVIYDESGMDPPSRRACWALVVDQLKGMRLGALRTVAALVVASPQVDVHASPGRGCRFAVIDGRLQERKPIDSASGDAGLFASRPSHARVLFLGAGFSFSSQLPLGNKLRDVAIHRLLGDVGQKGGIDSDSRSLAKRFRAWLVADGNLAERFRGMTEEQFADQLTLEQVLVFEQLRDPSLPTLNDFAESHARALSAPGRAVVALGDILRTPNRLVIVTVNFDELIEAQAPDLTTRFATDQEFESAEQYVRSYLAGGDLPVPLLKLHGTIGTPSSCIVSTSQTEQGMGPERRAALEAILPATGDRIPWTYVGASMRDVDIAPTLLEPRFANTLEERWVAPFLDPAVARFAEQRQPFWPGRTLQEHLVTEVADAYLELLRDRWPHVSG